MQEDQGQEGMSFFFLRKFETSKTLSHDTKVFLAFLGLAMLPL